MSSTQHAESTTNARLYVGAALIVVVSFLIGITISHGNGDRVCWDQQVNSNDSGSSLCTSGSWSAWTTVSQVTDPITGAQSVVEQRTYTGVTQTILGTVTVCNYAAFAGGGNTQGTYTSQYNACQIQETRSRVTKAGTGGTTGGSGGGAGGAGGAGANGGVGTVTNYQQTTTVGPAVGTSTQFTGTYQDYLNAISSQLATTSLSVVPSLVHPGDTTRVVWSSSHVSACRVQGTNGDVWNLLSSGPQGQVSGPITAQTIYTLTCTVGVATAPGITTPTGGVLSGQITNGNTNGSSGAVGNILTQQATVNIIPTYKEN